MTANELADELAKSENRNTLTYVGYIADAQAMLRQQQAEMEAMRSRFTLAFWHDTFVEVKKPNSDLVYRFKLDETNDR